MNNFNVGITELSKVQKIRIIENIKEDSNDIFILNLNTDHMLVFFPFIEN